VVCLLLCFASLSFAAEGSWPTAPGVTMTIYGRTARGDPGTVQRIVNVVGQIMPTGLFGPTVILSGVIQGEGIADGIAAFDNVTKQVFFCSDGAFGGTVFFADAKNLMSLPPMSYYLLPVGFLGYDPVSGSRLIGGTNTATKKFLMMEKPNWGTLNLYQYPPALKVTANDAFDGRKQVYYNAFCNDFGKCTMNVWPILTSTVTSFPLSCISANGVLTGLMMVSPNHTDTIIGVQYDAQDNYRGVTINVTAKTCMLSAVLPGLPPTPRIVVSVQIGPKSGYLVASIACNGYNMLMTWDTRFNLVSQVRMNELAEDIFVDEM